MSGILGAVLGIVLSIVTAFLQPDISRHIYGQRLTQFRVNNSKYGIPIKVGYGTVRSEGNVIWATDVQETEIVEKQCTKQGSYLGLGGGDSCIETHRYVYSQSFAVALSAGPGYKLLKIFADGSLIADFTPNNEGKVSGLTFENEEELGLTPSIQFYDGTNNAVDPTIASYEMEKDPTLTEDQIPVYEGIVYIVFKNIQLTQFGNRIPNISCVTTYDATDTLSTLYTIDAINNISNLFYTRRAMVANTATGFSSIDIELDTIIGSGTYIEGGNDLYLPYIDNNEFTYSSYLSGTEAHVVKYDQYAGHVIADILVDSSTTDSIKALSFYIQEGIVFASSDSKLYSFDLFTSRIDGIPIQPVISTYGYDFTSYGDTTSDMLCDSVGDIWLLRVNTASTGKEGWLIHYSKAAGYAAEAIQISLSGYVNPGDSSENLYYPSYLGDVLDDIVIASEQGDWIAKYSKTSSSITHYPSIPITTEDRLNVKKIDGVTVILSDNQIYNYDLTPKYYIDIENSFSEGHDTFTHVFALQDFGGYVLYDGTTLFKGIYREDKAIADLSDVVPDIILGNRVSAVPDIESGDINANTLSGIDVYGYILDQQDTISNFISELRTLHIFDLVEYDGKLNARLRGTSPIATILEDDLLSNIGDSSERAGIKITRVQDNELPSEVSVTYFDDAIDYNQGTQRAIMPSREATDKQDISVPATLTTNQAANIAAILLYNAWDERDQYAFNLGPEYQYLVPSDVIQLVSDSGLTFDVRLMSINNGLNGLLECDAVQEYQPTYSISTVGYIGERGEAQLINNSIIKLYIKDFVNVSGDGNTEAFVYVAPVSSSGTSYNIVVNYGGSIYTIPYSGYDQFIGYVTGIKHGNLSLNFLPPSDETSYNAKLSLTLIAINGSLPATAPSKDEIFANIDKYSILVDDELLIFTDYTYLWDGVYEVFGIYRNVVDIQSADYHTAGNYIFISVSSLLAIPLGDLSIGNSALIYAVSQDNPANKSNIEYYNISPASSMPFPVEVISCTKSINDIVIDWVRRDRVYNNWVNVGPLSNSEGVEKYELDILDIDGVVVRTESFTDISTYTYDQSAQVSDFGSVQDFVVFKIYQLKDDGTRGFALLYIFDSVGIYHDTIQEDTVGAQLSDTSTIFDGNNVSYLIQSGKRLELLNTAQNVKGLYLDNKYIGRNTETISKFYYSSSGSPTAGILRAGYSYRMTDNSALLIGFDETFDNIYLHEYDGTTLTELATQSVSISQDSIYYIKIKVIDNSIFIKLWLEGLYEPSDWTCVFNHTDSYPYGSTGIFQYGTNNTMNITYLEVETKAE